MGTLPSRNLAEKCYGIACADIVGQTKETGARACWGVRLAQLGLLEADHLYLNHVGRHTFYGFLASLRGQLFRDEEFAELYCPNNGRDSVPPSILAIVLLLQAHDRVSDEEAKLRADFDIRMKVALDTSYILGRGAVKGTYNLLVDGMVQVVRALAAIEGVEAEVWARQHELGCYFGSSIKGEAAIDWDDEKARQAFLQGIVADADGVLELTRRARGEGQPVVQSREPFWSPLF